MLDLTACLASAFNSVPEFSKFTNHAQLLRTAADALKTYRLDILEANTLDLEASREMSIPDLITGWLKLTPDRLQAAIDCLYELADLPSPISQRSSPSGYRRIPVGTVALVYEAIPELSIVAAGMCWKVGNALLLRGGSEVSQTQQAIVNILQEVLPKYGLPRALLQEVPKGTAIKDLLTQDKYLRLVIPYGRPSYVQQIMKQTTVAVLPAAMGNCYLYIAPTGNLDKALSIILDSRVRFPDPVSAIEKVIIHRSWLGSQDFLRLLLQLQQKGIALRGCEIIRATTWNLGDPFDNLIKEETKWQEAYLDNTLAIKVVDELEEAIAWINQNSSGHCDGILTDSLRESQIFASQVNSGIVYINHFIPFKRSHQNAYFSVALGMSSIKARGGSRSPGLIDVEALTLTKRVFVD
ncbi:MAG: aldehyde dehydrogenase family protein [Pseudanabaenaceae cyanobacterium]